MKQLMTLAAFFSAIICLSQTNEIDQLMLDLAYQKQDSSKVETSLKLITALYEADDTKKALMFIDETERLSKNLNYTKGIAETNYFKALIYADNNDYYNAVDSYNKSKQLFHKINDTLGIAKVNNSIGLIEIKRGNYASGLEHSLSAIRIFEERNLQKELSVAYNNLAEAYFNTKQIDKSLEFNFKALNIRERLNDISGIKSSNMNIAKLYTMRNEYRKAIEYYEKVLSGLDPKTDNELRGEILPLIGEQYLQFKEYEKAGEYLSEGLKYNRDTKNDIGLLRTLNSSGKLNLQKQNIKLAQIQINEARVLAKTSSDKFEVLKNYKLLVSLDSTKRNFQNAFFWQQQYYALKEDLNRENEPKIPVNTDLIKEDLSNKQLNESYGVETTNNESESTNQVKKLKIISYILVAAFLIVLTILLLIYLKRKNTIRYTQELEQKNEQIQLQNEAILEQTHHLEEINKVKDRLFSIVSHDLKDSISSIKGFLDLLKEDSITKEEFNELIPELSENANNASLLLYNLLNWSKSQMQNLEPNPELFNLQDIVHEKMGLVEQKVEQKRIVLIDESQRDFVYADKSMIEIVMQNLITNAVKFSRVGDIITVSNSDQNGKSLICVEDTGIGISKENLDKLFKNNAFTTIGTKNEKGTGLGLTICKELVELNNGKIWVESTQNVGTKFYVELPKDKQQPS